VLDAELSGIAAEITVILIDDGSTTAPSEDFVPRRAPFHFGSPGAPPPH
jgi:hypothetical protein